MRSQEPADRLLRFARLVERGEPLGADARWLAKRVREFLRAAPRGGTLEAALGLRPEWWERDGLPGRNAMIVETAAAFFPDQAPHSQAKALACACRRYQRARWRSDKRLATRPKAYDGKIEGHLFDLLKTYGALPGERQVRRILEQANCNGSDLTA